MAKTKHRKHHRRRRVSGIGSNDSLMMLLGGIGGYLAGNELNKTLTTVDAKIKAGAELALPVLFSKKLKTPILKGAAIGLGIAGAKVAGTAFNIPMLSGMSVVNGMAVVNGRRRMGNYVGNYVGGSADQPYLRTGAAGNNILNGIPKKMTSDELYESTQTPDYKDR